MNGDTDPRLLLLAEGDNVLITTTSIRAGELLLVDGHRVALEADVALGFKIAAHDLAEGTTAIRLGTPIGRATTDIARGEVIHTHNLESLYLRTHARGEQ
jgi:altronate dehydratase small subunit